MRHNITEFSISGQLQSENSMTFKIPHSDARVYEQGFTVFSSDASGNYNAVRKGINLIERTKKIFLLELMEGMIKCT